MIITMQRGDAKATIEGDDDMIKESCSYSVSFHHKVVALLDKFYGPTCVPTEKEKAV